MRDITNEIESIFPQPIKKLMVGEAVKIICQGDSITAGYDVTSSDKVPPTNAEHNTNAPITYPDALQQFLSESASGVITVVNEGISGQTAKMGYNYWTTNPGGDVVHLMYGLNDAGGAASATYDEFIDYMGRMIRRYIDWGFGVVVHTCIAQSMTQAITPRLDFLREQRRLRKCMVAKYLTASQFCNMQSTMVCIQMQFISTNRGTTNMGTLYLHSY
ncbi:SGNH/GDSL hydrolase family protein [Lelliottia nimipressuralis]|uniref:SGNH/GDSL hydrolase family protein n=1 Tax=Lelliottia nimipressuralis TaxID=69220 RepID=UPI003D2C62B5